MDMLGFLHVCEAHRPIVIALREDDYHQLHDALPATHSSDWNRDLMQYRGCPIVRSGFRSYIVEDTPDGPLCYML